jgi:formate hydrogenlyase subunit 3/multisubunit Na+/H+ antiporter MnhD subunit
MAFIGLLSLLLGLVAFFFLRHRRSSVRWAVSLALFLVPIITVIVLVALVGDRPPPSATTVQSAAK